MATDFRELRVWEEAMVLAEQVYRLTVELPAEERFGLSSQLKRAAVSVPSCIAEGNARRSTRDYLRFLSMSMGSLAEIRTQLLLSVRLGLLKEANAAPCLARQHTVTKLLQSLINSLQPKSDQIVTSNSSPFPVPRSRSRS